MRIEGKLTKWNDDRGFGFITPAQGGPEVFVHVSAFPRDGRRPMIGERLTYEIEAGRDGKQKAKNLLCPNRPAARISPRPAPRRRTEGPGFFARIIPVAVVVALAYYGYGEYVSRTASRPAVAAPPIEQPGAARFRCDGRTHCSQMNSCEEATFFLRNCPGVQMDGDGDGIPCERQLCG